jgi:hypothetical protein
VRSFKHSNLLCLTSLSSPGGADRTFVLLAVLTVCSLCIYQVRCRVWVTDEPTLTSEVLISIDVAPTEAPKLVLAQLNNQGTNMALHFDSPTDRRGAGLGASIDCAVIVSAATMEGGGIGPVCAWIDSRVLVLQLGYAATLVACKRHLKSVVPYILLFVHACGPGSVMLWSPGCTKLVVATDVSRY